MSDFEDQFLNKMSEEFKQISFFKEQTEKRIWKLEDKKQAKTITRAEIYELDACKYDLKRAKNYLSGKP